MVGYEDEMTNHCLGTIPELFDGNPPFKRAWSNIFCNECCRDIKNT